MLCFFGVFLASCSLGKENPDRNHGFPFVRDASIELENLEGHPVFATGIGCAKNALEASRKAKKTAKYNLRGIVGEGRYGMVEENLGRIEKKENIGLASEEDMVCIKVKAYTVPAN